MSVSIITKRLTSFVSELESGQRAKRCRLTKLRRRHSKMLFEKVHHGLSSILGTWDQDRFGYWEIGFLSASIHQIRKDLVSGDEIVHFREISRHAEISQRS